MKAFVAGATGETGRRIVQELITRNIPVRALVRDQQKARGILTNEAELVVGDVLNPESLTAALGDSTVLLCATGAKPSFDPTGPYKVDFEGTKNLVDAAKAKGIEHFQDLRTRLFLEIGLVGIGHGALVNFSCPMRYALCPTQTLDFSSLVRKS